MPPMTRRRLIQGSSLLAASALLSACGKGEVKPEDLWRTPNPSTKGYYGFIDESGSWAIPPQFHRFSFFSEDGVAPVLLRRDSGKRPRPFIYSGIIDTSGGVGEGAWVRAGDGPQLQRGARRHHREGKARIQIKRRHGRLHGHLGGVGHRAQGLRRGQFPPTLLRSQLLRRRTLCDGTLTRR